MVASSVYAHELHVIVYQSYIWSVQCCIRQMVIKSLRKGARFACNSGCIAKTLFGKSVGDYIQFSRDLASLIFNLGSCQSRVARPLFLAQGVIACSISARTKKGSGMVRQGHLFLTPYRKSQSVKLFTSLKTAKVCTWQLKKPFNTTLRHKAFDCLSCSTQSLRLRQTIKEINALIVRIIKYLLLFQRPEVHRYYSRFKRFSKIHQNTQL